MLLTFLTVMNCRSSSPLPFPGDVVLPFAPTTLSLTPPPIPGLSSRARPEIIRSYLLLLLHKDVIPIVVGYMTSLDVTLFHSFGAEGKNDGEMTKPSGLCLHKDELFVADYSNDRIQVFHEVTGRYLRQWSTNRSPSDRDLQFHPSDVTVANQEVFVTFPHFTGMVKVFRLSDCYFTTWFSPPWSCHFVGLAASPNLSSLANGGALLATQDNGEVGLFSRKGDHLKTLGTSGTAPGQFQEPAKLFIDEDEIFIADTGNNRVQVLSLSSGKYLRQYSQLSLPEAVIVHQDEVIVCDTDRNSLVIFDRTSSLPKWSISNVDVPLLQRPCALAINTRQELLVCNAGSHCVLVFE